MVLFHWVSTNPVLFIFKFTQVIWEKRLCKHAPGLDFGHPPSASVETLNNLVIGLISDIYLSSLGLISEYPDI